MPVVFLKQQKTRYKQMDAPLPTDIARAAAIHFSDRKLLHRFLTISRSNGTTAELLRKDTMEIDQELSRSIQCVKDVIASAVVHILQSMI